MKFNAIIAGFLTCFLWLNTGHGDMIEHGSFEGDTVFFQDITEISNTTDGAVFNAPQGSEDTLSFLPLGFQGLSSGGLDFEEGRLSFDLEARDGFVIDSISIVDASSFLLFGDDSMVMSNNFGVANVNGDLFTGSSSTEMSGDNFRGSSSTFESAFTIELPGVQQATFILDSQIFAAALGSTELASVSKDALVLRVATSPAAIPEPSGMVAVVWIAVVTSLRTRRRRKLFPV